MYNIYVKEKRDQLNHNKERALKAKLRLQRQHQSKLNI